MANRIVRPMPVSDRLAPFGVTIFTEMSALALEHDAINLGQGFPNWDGADFVKDAARDSMAAGGHDHRVAGPERAGRTGRDRPVRRNPRRGGRRDRARRDRIERAGQPTVLLPAIDAGRLRRTLHRDDDTEGGGSR